MRITRTVGSGKRKVAYWVAILYGSGIAVVMFGLGFQGFFSIGSNDTWLTILGGFTGTLMPLPLIIWAVFKPRPAAWAILLNASIACILFYVPSGAGGQMNLSFLEATKSLGFLLVYYGLAPALLFYATSQPRCEDESIFRFARWKPRLLRWSGSDRQAAALASAVVLGLIAGGMGFRWGFFVFRVSLHQRDWWGAVGVFAASLTLFPLSVAALLCPRWAAWAAFASLAVTWAYALTGADYHGGGLIGSAFLLVLWTLPLAAVGGLLLYATRVRRPGSGTPA